MRLFKRKNKAIEKFKVEGDTFISYEQLSEIKLNEVNQMVEEIGAIETTRVTSNNPSTLVFHVSMKKGEVWNVHHHDCKEVCVVFRGELEDEVSGRKALPAESLSFDAYEPHLVRALEDTIFYVEFKKPK